MGFAIPSNIAQRVARQLIETGTVEHPYLGVQMVTFNSAVQEELRLFDGEDSIKGVAIVRVLPNSPAAQARLQPGDIVVRAGKEEITTARELQRLVDALAVGDELSLEVLRDGKKLETTAVIEKLPTRFVS